MSDAVHEGVVETLSGSWAPPGSRLIELVFRTVGERTSQLALEFALAHVKPQRAHVIRDVKPFALAVQRMLTITHHCSHVVYVDADCLILEDLRPFLDANELPFVDGFGHDRFRGRSHCGVHITRLDVVWAMRTISPPLDDLCYVLRPESSLRRMALDQLGFRVQVKNFHILHDHFQRYTDLFAKYALRELRSRSGSAKTQLKAAMAGWGRGADFDVVRHALKHAVRTVPPGADPCHVASYIRSLPRSAQVEVERLGLADQTNQAGIEEVEQAVAGDLVNLGPLRKPFKVFGLGLPGTGTHSLTKALRALCFDAVNFPADRATLEALVRGDVQFPLLAHYDGIIGLTVVPYVEQLDRAWPGSKFILTVSEEQGWLDSCRMQWASPRGPQQGEEQWVYREVERFLRSAVFGRYEFDAESFRQIYRSHIERTTSYFAGRQDDLLVLDTVGGDGYEQLAPFLGTLGGC